MTSVSVIGLPPLTFAQNVRPTTLDHFRRDGCDVVLPVQSQKSDDVDVSQRLAIASPLLEPVTDVAGLALPALPVGKLILWFGFAAGVAEPGAEGPMLCSECDGLPPMPYPPRFALVCSREQTRQQ